MNKLFFSIISTVLLAASIGNSPVLAETSQEKKMIVVFENETNEQQIDHTIEQAGGTIGETFEEVAIASAEMTQEQAVQLEMDPDVKSVEEDIRFSLSGQVEDWGIQATNVPAAWKSGSTGKGVKIAVVDSGIAPHEDLNIAGGVSTVGYTTSYRDDAGHGTHVAGIIGARNNSVGTKGVAYDAKLYAVKSFDKNGSAYLSDIIEGVAWAIQNDMDIINISAGTQDASVAFESVINQAYASGILVVAAAGNDGTTNGLGDTVDFPARYNSAIAVGAIDKSLRRAAFSSTGPTVEVVAPGVNVYSTHLNGKYTRMSGTSMATPYVTGELALLKQAHPAFSNKELRALLVKNTKDLGKTGRDPIFGHGQIRSKAYTKPSAKVVTAPSFKDVTSFYSPAINYLVKGKITNGLSSTEFGVSKQIIRADAAVWLAKELKLDTEAVPASGFNDVPARAAGAVNALKNAGIIGGKSALRFGSNDPLTRGEIAIILQRAYGLSGNGTVSPFTDVSSRYKESVDALVANNITNGVSATKFGVGDNVTRGQLAVFIYRLSAQ